MGLFGYNHKDWRRATEALGTKLAAVQAIAEEKHPPSAQELVVAAALLTEQASSFPRGVKRTQVEEIDSEVLQTLCELETALHENLQIAPLCYAVIVLNSLRTVRACCTELRPTYAAKAELDFAKAVSILESLQEKLAEMRAVLRALGSNEDLDVKELHVRQTMLEEQINMLRRHYTAWRSALAKEEQILSTLSPDLLVTLRQVCAPVLSREI